MRTGLMAVLAGGLALAGCAYPYGAPGYGYGGGYGYGPSYAQSYGYSPGYAQGYGYSPGYAQPYGYRPGWNGGQQLYRDGNRDGQPQRAWNGQSRQGSDQRGSYQRSNQPAQRAATPETKSFERSLGFVPN